MIAAGHLASHAPNTLERVNMNSHRDSPFRPGCSKPNVIKRMRFLHTWDSENRLEEEEEFIKRVSLQSRPPNRQFPFFAAMCEMFPGACRAAFVGVECALFVCFLPRLLGACRVTFSRVEIVLRVCFDQFPGCT
jgi:hypothetical protein